MPAAKSHRRPVEGRRYVCVDYISDQWPVISGRWSVLKNEFHFFGFGGDVLTRSVSVVVGWVFAYFAETIRPVFELRWMVRVVGFFGI